MSPAPTSTALAGGGATGGAVDGEGDHAGAAATPAAREALPTGADAGSSSVSMATATSDIQRACTCSPSRHHEHPSWGYPPKQPAQPRPPVPRRGGCEGG